MGRLNGLREKAGIGWVVARNLLLGTNARALAADPRPRPLAFHVTELLFLQQALLRRRGLVERAVTEVVGRARAEVVLAPEAATAWFDQSPSYAVDLVSLCLLCRAADPAPQRIFEIGTSVGTTALHFALNTPPAARIYTLDLPADGTAAPALRLTAMDEAHIRGRRSIGRYHFEGRPEAAKIECLSGDSATFDYSPYEGTIDLFFVDGAHSYEYVRADTEAALRCVRPGGIVAWHDFGRQGLNGVSRRLHELRREHGREIFVVPGGSLAYTIT
jgi:predicted O-methyltransferase YrrM